MKKSHFLSVLIVAVSFSYFAFLSADLPGKPPTTINQPNPDPFPKPPSQPEPPLPRRPGPRPQRQQVTTVREQGVSFTMPGIVGISEGRWAGSDNLFNLPPSISIFVELVMPEDKKFPISDHEIRNLVQGLFSRGGISPMAYPERNGPPLPLYHVLIMVSEVDGCLTACCGCRLFESVTLDRVILERGITFQAITWEKQDLITASQKDFYPLLNKTVEDITSAFIQRFHYFQNIRAQRQR